MNLDIQKFKKEIFALRGLKREQTLHPLLKGQIKQRVMQAILEMPKEVTVLPVVSTRFKILRYLVPISAGTLLFAGTVFAAGGSNPGDVLYPVKIAKENIELTLAPTAAAKARVRVAQAEARITELEKIDDQTNKDIQTAANIQTPVTLPGPSQAASTAISTPTATATPLPTPTPTPTADSRDGQKAKERLRLQILAQEQAETRAKAQVNSALENLTQVQNQLSASGDNKGAADIGNRILNLRQKARLEKLLNGQDQKVNDGSSGDDNNSSGNGNTSGNHNSSGSGRGGNNSLGNDN